jgi:predicted nucleic acid-binding protein
MSDFTLEIAVDSNALTYLIEATSAKYDPIIDSSGLATERIAMIRIFLYCGIAFIVLPSVKKEYKQILNEFWRGEHDEFTNMLLLDLPFEFNKEQLEHRSKELIVYHNKKIDCQILAEAEMAHINFLLTCDNDFIKNLGPYAKGLIITRPSKFFDSRNIKAGSNPKVIPSPSNPLSNISWWRI